MMNQNNEITVQTALFGFIAEEAHSDRFSVTINKQFKENLDNAMMVPMNIRPDDVAFTVSQMRHSKLSGAFIAPEYQDEIVSLLDYPSDDVRKWGICDFVEIKDEKLYGHLLTHLALWQWCMDKKIRRVALVGAAPLMGAFGSLLSDIEVSYFDEEIELLIPFVGEHSDINRLGQSLKHDMSTFDAVIDFRYSGEPIEGIIGMPNMALDFAKNTSSSRLREMFSDRNEMYGGYDVIMPSLCEITYKFLKERIV